MVSELSIKELTSAVKEKAIYIVGVNCSRIIKKNNVLNFEYEYQEKETGEVKEASTPFSRQYTASLSVSLDNKQLAKAFPDEIKQYKRYTKSTKYKLFTDAIVSVTFKDIYDYDENRKKIKPARMTSEQAREELYTKGFTYKNNHYVEYKRSGAKARVGATLFIKEDLLKTMIDWSNLDLDFSKDDDVDIASLRAYQSLTLSGLDTTEKHFVKIKPSEILVIDEAYSKFAQEVMLTEEIEGKIVSTRKEIEVNNNIWDGQCLADESLFAQCERSQYGIMLLRQRMFKADAINTKIQQYYKDNDITVVYDKWGNHKRAEQIKLIITESCLKFFKFAYKFKGDDKACFDYWCKKLQEEDNVFGIVKSEHPSKMGNMHQLSYQMMNSLMLDKAETKELAQLDIDYINKLSTDVDAFIEHINKNEDSYNRQAICDLIALNKNFVHTKMFKEFRRKTIDILIQKLRQGKVHVKNTDYMVMCSNPFMMLQATHKQDKVKIDEELQGYQIYCSKYEEGQVLAGIRNPQICTGNIASLVNVKPSYVSYFNITDNVVIVNSICCDIMNRLQGCDYDVDTLLLSDNHILTQKALEAQSHLTPINNLEGTKKLLPLTNKNKSDIDTIISQNAIGKVINTSQTLVSMYNQTKDNGVYTDICTLSSISQIEIDKAKKFIEIDSFNICKDIEQKYLVENGEVYKSGDKIGQKKKSIPVADWMVSTKIKPKSFREFPVKYNCAMEYLQEMVKDEIVDIKRSADLDIADLLQNAKSDKKGKLDNDKLCEVLQIIKLANKEVKLKHKLIRQAKEDEETFTHKREIREITDTTVDVIKKYKLNAKTIYTMLVRQLDNKDSQVINNCFRFLILSNPEQVRVCFK